MSVTILVLSVAFWSVLCAVADAQSGSSSGGGSSPPWVNEACENPGMGKGSQFPLLSNFYYVDLYSSPSTSPDPNATDPNQREFIVSLCNRTLKTPRGTKNCPIGNFFIGVWTASGDCVQAYDTARATNVQGNNNSGYNITMTFGSSYNSTPTFTVLFTCTRSSVSSTSSIGDQTLIQSALSLCAPTPAPSSPFWGKTGGGSDSVVVPVVVTIAAVACVVIGVGIGYLCFKRRSLPSAPQPIPGTVVEDGLDSPPSDRRGLKSTD